MPTSVLEGCGYKVVTADTAREALESMEQNTFDLILLAYRLPRMIGFKVARDLKRRCPGKGATLDSLLTKIRALIGRT